MAKRKTQAARKRVAVTRSKPGGAAGRAPAAHRAKRSSATQREEIIATAEREHLSALDVQKRFGVKAATYYAWRKTRKRVRGGLGATVQQTLAGFDVAGEIRRVLRAELERMLPAIVQDELDQLLGNAR